MPCTARGAGCGRASMEPGDILFFEGLGHVGLYLGSGRMVHAPQTGRNVEIVRLGEHELRHSPDRRAPRRRRLTHRHDCPDGDRGSFMTKKRLDVAARRARAGGLAVAGAGARARGARPRAQQAGRAGRRTTSSSRWSGLPRFVSRGGEKLAERARRVRRRRRRPRLRGRRRVDGRVHRLPAPGRRGARRRDRRRLRAAPPAASLGSARDRPRARERARAHRAAVPARARRLRRLVHQRDEGAPAGAPARGARLGGARPREAAVRGGTQRGGRRASCAIPDVQRNVLETRHRSRTGVGCASRSAS